MFIRQNHTIRQTCTYCHRFYNYDHNIHLNCSLIGEGRKGVMAGQTNKRDGKGIQTNEEKDRKTQKD
jgi:hypothetical protein